MTDLTKTLLAFTGQKNVITIYRAFVEFTGSLEAAIMLSQLLYWTPRSERRGWIAKSDKEFQEELSLTRYAIRTARKALQDMGIIQTKLKRFKGAPTIHYKVNLEELEKLWIIRNRTIADYPKTDNQGLSENGQSLTEITSETTKTPPKPPKPKSEYVKNMEHLEKIFADTRGTALPNWEGNGAGLNKTWRSPLRRILKSCNGDLDLATKIVIKATKNMMKDELTFSEPVQIERTANSLIADLTPSTATTKKRDFTAERLAKEKAQ